MHEALKQLTAGGCAGLAEVCCMHPLDLIKTRMQVSGGSITTYQCIYNTVSQEGALALYKGIVPPILAETPKRAIKFICFEQYKGVAHSLGFSHFSTMTLAGLGSGLTEAFVICPFEVLKVQLQVDRASGKQALSTPAVARRILSSSGLSGFYRGITSTLTRNGLFNMIYFSVYHNGKNVLATTPSLPSADSLPCRLGLGFLAGTLASAVNIPADVAKSRIQGPQPAHPIPPYYGCVRTVLRVANEEGWRALYKGLAPKILRLGPGGAIMLVVYEEVHKRL